MNTYYKIAILVFGFIVLAAALWFVVFRRPAPQVLQTPKTLDTILNELSSKQDAVVDTKVIQPVITGINLKTLSAQERIEQEVSFIVRIFVERFGTYANQTNYEGIRSLDNYMSDQLIRFTDKYIEDLRLEHPYQDGYYGITTKVVSVDFSSLTPASTRVQVMASTRRQESTTLGEGDAYNQDAKVELIKVGGKWVVDGIFWK